MVHILQACTVFWSWSDWACKLLQKLHPQPYLDSCNMMYLKTSHPFTRIQLEITSDWKLNVDSTKKCHTENKLLRRFQVSRLPMSRSGKSNIDIGSKIQDRQCWSMIQFEMEFAAGVCWPYCFPSNTCDFHLTGCSNPMTRPDLGIPDAVKSQVAIKFYVVYYIIGVLLVAMMQCCHITNRTLYVCASVYAGKPHRYGWSAHICNMVIHAWYMILQP